MTLTMNEAFKLRNDLKKLISHNNALMNAFSVTVDADESVDDAFTAFDGVSFDKMYNMQFVAMNTLSELNTKIDEANVAIRPTLNRIETAKSILALNDMVLESIRSFRKTRTEVNPVTGVSTKVQQIMLLSNPPAYLEHDKQLKQQIHKMEVEVAKQNSLISFDFEIDDTIYEKIMG
jgi:hypothetical protein